MNYFLAKTDPDTYSIDDLAKDKKTLWDGVHSFAAIKFIGEMKVGDKVLMYHSQVKGSDGPGIVGLAKVISAPRDNPKDTRKSKVVGFEFVKKFKNSVPLKTIKDTGEFNEWALIKQGRLSVMPVPEEFIKWLKTIESV